VITLIPPGRRLSSAGLALGLLTAALAAVTLVDSAVGPAPTDRTPESASPRPLTVSTAAARAGLRLLSAAASAALTVPYGGEQLVAWWGPQGSSMSLIQVWHPRNRSVRANATDMGAAPAGLAAGLDGPSVPGPAIATSPAAQDPDGVLGISQQMVDLIPAHYSVAAAGRGQVAGRPAVMVQLTRPDGSLAARFWLDQATKLLLRREIFDTGSTLISEDTFLDLNLSETALAGMPAQSVSEWPAKLTAAQVTALRAQGWPAPGGLPGGLRLLAAHRTSQAVDLDYSDGLSVVSVFVQRGELPVVLPGWREISVSGYEVYSSDPDQRSLSWSAHGFVYTVIAAAPPAVVSSVVAAMPHDPPRGFWGRIAHGLKRLASWANPFR
jgi:sigma-E factor negative regulatory protein RseB